MGARRLSPRLPVALWVQARTPSTRRVLGELKQTSRTPNTLLWYMLTCGLDTVSQMLCCSSTDNFFGVQGGGSFPVPPDLPGFTWGRPSAPQSLVYLSACCPPCSSYRNVGVWGGRSFPMHAQEPHAARGGQWPCAFGKHEQNWYLNAESRVTWHTLQTDLIV